MHHTDSGKFCTRVPAGGFTLCWHLVPEDLHENNDLAKFWHCFWQPDPGNPSTVWRQEWRQGGALREEEWFCSYFKFSSWEEKDTRKHAEKVNLNLWIITKIEKPGRVLLVKWRPCKESFTVSYLRSHHRGDNHSLLSSPGECLKKTEQWLMRYNVVHSKLLKLCLGEKVFWVM